MKKTLADMKEILYLGSSGIILTYYGKSHFIQLEKNSYNGII